MTILLRQSRKSMRPARQFGQGIHVNILEPTAEERQDLVAVRATPIDRRTLPTVDGAGLTMEEQFRINGAFTRARVAYAHDAPEADAIELDRVARRAAVDELRRLLRDRLTAPPLPCCDAGEPAPCLACAAPVASIDPGDVESDPATWGPEWDNWLWTTNDDDQVDKPTPAPRPQLLTLPDLLDSEAARYRRMETKLGDLLAKTLGDLASTARLVQAWTPGDLEARLEVLDRAEDAWLEPEPELTAAGRWA